MVEYFSNASGLPPKVKDFILKSSLPLSISDSLVNDSPLVGVNEPFCKLTGYTPSEILGRNCRFLQPLSKKPPVCLKIREFLEDSKIENKRFLVPNLRKDGSKFVNLLYLSKIKLNGAISFYLGSQFDFSKYGHAGIDLHEEALASDLENLNALANDMGWMVLGSMDAMASSHTLVAKAKFDQDFLEYE